MFPGRTVFSETNLRFVHLNTIFSLEELVIKYAKLLIILVFQLSYSLLFKALVAGSSMVFAGNFHHYHNATQMKKKNINNNKAIESVRNPCSFSKLSSNVFAEGDKRYLKCKLTRRRLSFFYVLVTSQVQVFG